MNEITQADRDADLIEFMASDAACYLYPGEDQQAERAAYARGCADFARHRMEERDANEKRIAELERNSTDKADAWDAIAEKNKRIAELEQVKWEQRHTSTMNDIVQMGMARDAALDRIAELEAENERIILLAAEWMGDIEYAQFTHAALGETK